MINTTHTPPPHQPVPIVKDRDVSEQLAEARINWEKEFQEANERFNKTLDEFNITKK